MVNNIFIPTEFNPDAVVIDNGEYPTHTQPLKWINEAPYTICCDGAADLFMSKGKQPDMIIGDGDSISKYNALKNSIKFLRVADQETNDQTKAVDYLISQGKKNILIVAGTGKREDHTLGNISLLVEYIRKGAFAMMATDYGIFIPCHNNIKIQTQKGQQISIFNINAIHFTAEGLIYPLPKELNNWWQGTLNECATDNISFNAEGDFIVFLNYLA